MKKFLLKYKSILGCVYRGLQEGLSSYDSRKRTRYAYYYKFCKVRSNMVLYESFYGKGMLCNPYAIFQELMRDPEFKNFIHVWVLKDPGADKLLLERYRGQKNVVFVTYGSKAYLKYLCTAKYLFNNSTFDSYFTKKDDQVYVNTWHGIPLKTLGYDMPNGALESGNVVRNFLMTDYMISASPFLTDIYRKSYRLENLYGGKIIEEGYPRLDILARSDRNAVLSKLRSYGVQVEDGKQIILFAPTWRGTTFAHASADISFCYELKERLEQIIDTSRYQILIKLHQQVYELVRNSLKDDFFVPSMIDANEMLAVTDVLINDFSSIYFDFLATGRPILFYIPDLELYREQRGLYRGTDALPGPCTDSVDTLGAWINDLEATFAACKDKYNAERTWSNGDASGQIAGKIVDIVFRKNEAGYKIHAPHSEKKRILISRGKMRVNGISSSLLSFLDHLDYDQFDVSVMLQGTNVEEELAMIKRIDPRVRFIWRNAMGCYTLGEQMLQHHYIRTTCKNVNHRMYVRDVRRIYGNSLFDYVIDFDGYNPHFSAMLLQFPDAYKCIWMHSDMMAERNARFPWLERIFQLYPYFDKLVSCSYEVMLVNRKNLSPNYCGPEKFGYMKNFVDDSRLDSLCQLPDVRHYEGLDYIVANEEHRGGAVTVQMLPLVPDTTADGQKNYRFVTMGRLSGEKNHISLIHALHKLSQENPNVYLYILGNGPLKPEMDALVASLGLGDRVFMPGNAGNPFAVMRNCDCFILPSLHEGQPMVIHEARGLKMPIIVSNFSSVGGVLVDNGQLVIGTEIADIYEGMKKFIAGEVPTDYHYDIREYNREAYGEFLKVLELQ